MFQKFEKYYRISIFVISLCFFIGFSFTNRALAATVINARLLPTIWYSNLTAKDGESITIYAGIQNNSGINFSGTANFFVDDSKIATNNFSSQTDNLINVSATWLAVPGSHNVQVTIDPVLASSTVLVSTVSDKSSMTIIRNIDPVAIQNAVTSGASTVINQTNYIANNLADKVETWKNPATPQSLFGNGVKANGSNGSGGGNVSGGATSKPSKISSDGNISPVTFVYNTFVDLLAFLIRNWKWTIGSMVVLYIIYKIVGKFRK